MISVIIKLHFSQNLRLNLVARGTQRDAKYTLRWRTQRFFPATWVFVAIGMDINTSSPVQYHRPPTLEPANRHFYDASSAITISAFKDQAAPEPPSVSLLAPSALQEIKLPAAKWPSYPCSTRTRRRGGTRNPEHNKSFKLSILLQTAGAQRRVCNSFRAVAGHVPDAWSWATWRAISIASDMSRPTWLAKLNTGAA